MTTMRLSGEQVTQLVELLTVAAAAATSDEDRYQLHYSRSQVRQLMPAIEVLVLAGVLADMTDRPGPDLAIRNACRWWSAELAGLLSVASAATAAAIGLQLPSPTERGSQAQRLAA
jgi:N-acetylglucosamine-6-phosphate deacetylase